VPFECVVIGVSKIKRQKKSRAILKQEYKASVTQKWRNFHDHFLLAFIDVPKCKIVIKCFLQFFCLRFWSTHTRHMWVEAHLIFPNISKMFLELLL